jgi:hypothetical protein
MDIRVDANLQSVISRLNGVRADVPRAIEAGLDDEARVLGNAKIRQVNKTYSRSIPKTKKGKPKYKRSGAWLRGQRTVKAGRFVREIRDTGKAAEPIKNYPGGYAEKLSVLEVSKDGVNRRNAAAPEAERITAPQRGIAFQQGVRNSLGL